MNKIKKQKPALKKLRLKRINQIASLILINILLCNSTNAQAVLGADNEVRPVNTKMMIDGMQVFYALPKNIVRFEITIKHTESIKGPYADYASKFLNISDGIIVNDNSFYKIKNVQFNRFSIADSSQFYAINYKGIADFPEIQLNEDGVILGCNVAKELIGYDIASCQMIKPTAEDEDFLFYDLGVRSFLEEQLKTLYKTVQTDSTPKRVPYKQKSLTAKSTEENAMEAAAFILKLRKRKLKLLTGQFEEVNPIDGVAMATMVQSLNDLEQKYIELFTGKSLEYTQKYYFDYSPSSNNGAEQTILCWFSPSQGIVADKPDIRKSDYEPVLLKAMPMGSVPQPKIQVMNNTQKSPSAIKYGLYHRIPGRIEITLQLIDEILAKQQVQIAQKGEVIPMPIHYLNNKQYGIEFYSETGALKRISHNKDLTPITE